MKCFHHDDLDGKSAGAVVAYFEKNYDQNDFFKVDYVMDLSPMLEKIQEGERVYFVDYSFTEPTKWVLEKLQEKNCEVIWIDHHSSSINLEKEHPELQKIKGSRSNDYSGVALVYMYFKNCNFDECPQFIQLVSDYDNWVVDFEPYTTFFKLGLDSCNNESLSELWLTFFEEYKLYEDSFLISLIENGRVIKQYINEDNKNYRNNFSYVSEIRGNKCLVVNRKSNSWIFGDQYSNFPLVMVWTFNGEKYSYSIFSSNPNIDCSKIAESYGGGGHAGAAGFALDNMPFKKTENRGF